MAETNIESLLKEQRVFPPSPEFSRQAHIHSLEVYDSISKRAFDDPEGFWADIASELHWFEPWEKVLEWNARPSTWVWCRNLPCPCPLLRALASYTTSCLEDSARRRSGIESMTRSRGC